MTQHRNRTRLLAAIATLFALSPLPALAAAPINLRGTITNISGNTIDIKETDGSTAAVRLADDAAIVSVAKASLSDIKPGSYIGTAATPRTDGTLQAIEVHIFPKSMRGAGEGTRAWDLKPKSSMTNGTVTAGGGNWQLNVTYHGAAMVNGKCEGLAVPGKPGCTGTSVVDVTPNTPIVAIVPYRHDLVKPGVYVVAQVLTDAAGKATVASATVEKGGVKPEF